MTSPYISRSQEERRAMLAVIGVSSPDDLFHDIPPDFRDPHLHLPPPASELELKRELRELAGRNLSLEQHPCFLGGGAYRHFIPSVVGHIASRSEFSTAYTPYQPEISQGTLQAIFEYQSMICQLTEMEVCNAGMYDGASALAEAALMAARITNRRKVALLSSVRPAAQEVVSTYAIGQDLAIETFQPTSLALTEEHACLLVQQPNFFGYLEDLTLLERVAHAAGALLVVSVDPISLGMFRPPGAYGADIVVAEGQALGNPLSFGGPYLGVFSCREKHVRQMPGRVVGQTRDAKGRLCYVMTLQTREQHIRREHATSNICTNQALNALAATVYLAALGPQGLRQVAELCYHKAHYAAQRIAELPGYSLPLAGTFFKEFLVRCPVPPAQVNHHLLEAGTIGGLDVSPWIENGLLLCFTEMNTKQEIDQLVEQLREIHDARQGA